MSFLFTVWSDFSFGVYADDPDINPESSVTLYHPHVFLDFSEISFLGKHHISFFGYLPRTLNTSPNNINHHSYFFLILFFYFIPIFHVEMQMFPYLEMYIGPWKHCPRLSPTIPHFSLIFWLFYCYFSVKHSHAFHIWKCALDPENIAQDGHQPSPIFLWFFGYFIAIFHSA